MSLAQKVVRGAAWNVAASMGARVFSLASTLLVARFLTPSEYGEFLGAAIVAQTCLALSQLGLGQYVVARPKAGDDEVFHATLFGTVVCVALLAVAFAADEVIGPYFHVSDLIRYLPWLAAMVVLDRIVTIPERLMQRDLRFRTVALNRAAGELVYAVAAVALVSAGMGGMGLVAANLARSVQRALVIIVEVDWRRWARPHPLRWQTTKAIFRYGLPLSVGNAAGFISTKWDNLLTSRYFGAGPMGAYNLAYSLAELPIAQVAEQIGDVLLPSFAHLDPNERRRALARTLPLLALIMFPLAIGLAAISDSVVHTFFDARWAAVGPMLSVLAALAVARPISYAFVSFLQAESRVMTVSILESGKVALLFVTMVAAAPHGLLALCGAVGLAFAAHALVGLWLVSGPSAPFGRTMLRLARPLLATAPMVFAVLGVRWALERSGSQRAWLSLLCEVAAGAALYVGAAWIIANPTARELVELTRSAIARRRTGAPAP